MIRKFIQILRLALALAYSALIVFLSSQSTWPTQDIGIEFNDKILHVAEYFVFTLLWCWVLIGSPLETMRRGQVWKLIFSAVLFAVSDEIHQFFVPGRDADILDLIADLCGIFAGFFVFLKLRRSVDLKHFDRFNRFFGRSI